MSSSLSQRTCLVVVWSSCVISYVPIVLCVMCWSHRPSCRCLRTILSDSAVILGLYQYVLSSRDYARVRPLAWYFVSHDGLCTILRTDYCVGGVAWVC